MFEHWFHPLRLSLSIEEFARLPRHPAYRYQFDHAGNCGHLHPQPLIHHAVKTLESPHTEAPLKSTSVIGGRPASEPPETIFRPISHSDWPVLEPLFVSAFRSSVPLQTLSTEDQLLCAQDTLAQTRNGGDGPLVTSASFLSIDSHNLPCAAILVTLLPVAELGNFADPAWSVPAPVNALEQRWGRPHLTWIFVEPAWKRRGLGGHLLNLAEAELYRLGYRELASTFLVGHESSMLWHWKQGFRLLSHPCSSNRSSV